MAYLKNENNEIIVDAILTKYGRDKLSKQGQLAVSKFSLSDDEVDYALYNVNNPSGVEFYDVAIRELPILEALPGNDVAMKYHLFTNTDASVSTITTLSASVPNAFTAGVTTVNIPYAITPILTPQPAQLEQIYYVAEQPLSFVGISADFAGIINPSIGLTNQMKDTAAQVNSGGGTHVVGHSFTFTLKSRPRYASNYTIKITAFGPVNTNTYSFNIYVPGIYGTTVVS